MQGNNCIIAAIEDKQKELQKIILKKEEKISTYPKGKIHIIDKKKFVQFYVRESAQDTPGTYIKKKDVVKLKSFLQKSYDTKVLNLLKDEYNLLENFKINSESSKNSIYELYTSYPESAQKYITPVTLTDEEFIQQWKNIPYEPNPYKPENKTQDTANGEKVRSKSELSIANYLYYHNIPYKYEYPIMLKNNIIVYPDFAILNVRERKVYYWEHRGLMDERNYAKDSVWKIKEYNKAGFIIGKNLIITEETSDAPLTSKEIERIVKAYFM